MKPTVTRAAAQASHVPANDPARLENLAQQLAEKFSSTLLQIARTHAGEADFRREAARLFEQIAEQADIKLDVRDEFRIAKGRVDAVYNRLVIEYEHPGALRHERGKGGNPHAVQQVKDYILGVAKKHRREESRLAGVAMDGHYFIFVRRVGEGWIEDDPVPTNAASAAYFLRLLFSLSVGAALVPENLINDFGPKTLQAQRAVRAIYATLHSSKQPLVQKLFEQWRIFFAEATDYKEWAEQLKSKPEFQAFVASLWTKEEIGYLDPAKVFFVLHTYYALLIKLVASLAAARFAGGSTAPLAKMAMQDDAALLDSFRDLERGGLFRAYGIRNFLEGDFFGWYLAAWNNDVAEAVRALVRRLSEYDPGSLELAPENARDLLKKLYHYLLPREIRHDLGEYYTPDWLAERLIRQTLTLGGGQSPGISLDTRILDPACGSGTFLVLIIRFMRNAAERKGLKPAAVLSAILKNVVGIDLNPLAVIAARTNYLLALGDLLKHRQGEIDIPIYQADSVLTPSRGSDLFTDNVYQLKTSVGEFRVPAIFAERERIDILANLLDECVENRIAEDVFINRLSDMARLKREEVEVAKNDLVGLYRQLRELHDQGLNGVWARIIKNAFAPLFIEPGHYVVGNPPWVNWRNLPDQYREDTTKLWIHYGLFPKREDGLQTILGHTNYDISTLMTSVAIDKYLCQGGKLGFVLSQSLFKTSGAGDGFRQFTLPDKTPFGPFVVEDMVDLNPFEGAANRTSVAIFLKGRPVKYPVSYQYWKRRKRGRGSSIGFDTPYEDITKEKITSRAWVAEPINPQVPTSAWLTGRPKAVRAVRRITGQSGYQARIGAYTGGANAIFWIEVVAERPGGLLMISNVTEGAKKKVIRVQAAIEADLVFPLLRGSDVGRWLPESSISILLTHELGEKLNAIPVETMQRKYPKTYSYLHRFETFLKGRAAFKRYFKPDAPFYSMFDVGDYSFAEWKVVWREQASQMTAAVVGPHSGTPVIPDHKLLMVHVSSRTEAHYLCAALNSAPVRFAVASYTIQIQMDAHILENVAIPVFEKTNPIHQRLSELSQAAHKAVAKGPEIELTRWEEEIDRWAAKLWGMSDEELAEIKKSLEET